MRARVVLAGVVLCTPGCDELFGPDPEPPLLRYSDVMPIGPEGLITFAMGDWGTGGEGQMEVAGTLAFQAEGLRPRQVLLLGDNFYERGVSGTDDPQWVEKFEQVYTGRSLDIPFWAVPGNHDYLTPGSVAAQVAYTALSSRWRMPAPYYTFADTVPYPTPTTPEGLPRDGTGDGLDTLETRYHSVSVRFIGLDTDALLRGDGADQQLQWLDSVLAARNETWTVVFGHHPTRAAGPHGLYTELEALLQPRFDQYAVDVYVAGHVHSMQLVRRRSTIHVASGGGAGMDRSHPVGPTRGAAFARRTGGFAALAFTDRCVGVLLIKHDGFPMFPFRQCREP